MAVLTRECVDGYESGRLFKCTQALRVFLQRFCDVYGVCVVIVLCVLLITLIQLH
jgi:hypothetical protein